MLVVASTLTLSIQQRRCEFALLRAVAASRGQIHRMVGAEILLVAGSAAILGAGPGIAVAYLLRSAFAAGGVLPADFGLALSPLPAVAAILLCVGSARVAGWVAARRPARISPVEALDESAVEPPALHRFRVLAGWVAAVLGVAAAGLPTLIPGEAAVAGAASSAVLLVAAVYGRGLGFGDVTLPHDVLAAHTTIRSDQSILVRACAHPVRSPGPSGRRDRHPRVSGRLTTCAAALRAGWSVPRAAAGHASF